MPAAALAASAAVPRSVAAFDRFWPLFSWPRKAAPEPDFAVFWPFRAGFGPAAAAANRGPHGGGAHAALGSLGGGAVVQSAGGVGEAVFSGAMAQSIGIGHAFASWRRAAEKVARHGEPILPNVYVFVNMKIYLKTFVECSPPFRSSPASSVCSSGCSRTGLARTGKGDRLPLCGAPHGPFRQMVPVPFSGPPPPAPCRRSND